MKRIIYVVGLTIFFMSCGSNESAEQAETTGAKKVGESSGTELLIDPETSKVNWRGTKVGGEHFGFVEITGGSIMVDKNRVTGGKINIDLNSIVVEDLTNENMNARLTGHLKSEDFFFTEQYPDAVFEIVSIEEFKGEASGEINPNYKITGNLTMRGKTNSISFPAFVEINDESVIAKTNEFSIDRTKWDVNFKSKTVFAEFKDDYIDDLMNLKFDVAFKK